LSGFLNKAVALMRDYEFEEDPDAPQAIDLDWDDDDEDDLIQCLNCHRMIPEITPRCPSCGYWIEGETTAERRSQGWFWPMMVGFLVAVIFVIWISRGG
jgi:hypothetical protein